MTDLTVAIADGIALLTLNRPERRNAYTAEMGALLNRAYRQCDDDDAVRVNRAHRRRRRFLRRR